ncbi:DUF4350 domain-containing protein [Pseudemcibacter aquimaris]|uniref:DUF4350 domain-containing protein n=1 Tax=Pseudemcibacter aquimaris TaxID=2857064 RepID=UPI002012C53A|nr:hypothetical protein [Pseudemcibacter aquimaris]MCC3861193.1 hypothetical protein [Pseudemcibacter aquimaris]WDU57968.1 hypothetical protein KW060_12280 [Pseudemcibacter aquimaris]
MHPKSRFTILLFGILTCALSISTAQETDHKVIKREFVDAVKTDYVPDFPALTNNHGTRVLIDRFHETIYSIPDEENGTMHMQDMMRKDGFTLKDANTSLDQHLNDADVLIIHGLPNNKIELPNGGEYWKSPLSSEELDAIIRFIDNGGGLYLSLSHWPGGGGALPILEALNVKLRDGYVWSKEYPSYTDPASGICSHYFGMSEKDNTLNKKHPVAGGPLPVNKVDFLCGTAIFREKEDAILPFPAGSINYTTGEIAAEISDDYAGMIGFTFGKGKVVVATDQGMFRNFIFTFSDGEKTEDIAVTLSPNNDNANLFINMMRWLSPKID